jgi:hypothetical protein
MFVIRNPKHIASQIIITFIKEPLVDEGSLYDLLALIA